MVASGARLGVFFLCLAAIRSIAEAQPTATPTLSGCQVCASTGNCSHAYLDGPGQFCGNWLDKAAQRQRCCCPRDALCKLSNYECKCSWPPSPPPAQTKQHETMPSGGWIGVAVGGVVLLSCCVGTCWCISRAVRKKNQRTRAPGPAHVTSQPMVGVPVARAVYAPGVAEYPYASAPSAPVYDYGSSSYGHHHHHHDHHSAGLSTGVAVVAGVATGMVIADIASDGFTGDGGFTGAAAYDSGADTGGFGGGYDGGGGDSGGGGGDFGGDF